MHWKGIYFSFPLQFAYLSKIYISGILANRSDPDKEVTDMAIVWCEILW